MPFSGADLVALLKTPSSVAAAAPQTTAPTDRNHELFLVLVSPGKRLFWRTAAFHWLGWVLTAIAVSLGAPFWFDMLDKFITIRSSVAGPENQPAPPTQPTKQVTPAR